MPTFLRKNIFFSMIFLPRCVFSLRYSSFGRGKKRKEEEGRGKKRKEEEGRRRKEEEGRGRRRIIRIRDLEKWIN